MEFNLKLEGKGKNTGLKLNIQSNKDTREAATNRTSPFEHAGQLGISVHFQMRSSDAQELPEHENLI